jgi:hypothetical protein
MAPACPVPVVSITRYHTAATRAAMLLGSKWIEVERFPVVRTGSAVSRQQGFQSRRSERACSEGSNSSSDLVEQ